MADPMKMDTALLHRSTILNGLRALYLAHNRSDRFLKEESYACGYREGFQDALESIAQMVGVSEEYEATRRAVNSYTINALPVYQEANGK